VYPGVRRNKYTAGKKRKVGGKSRKSKAPAQKSGGLGRGNKIWEESLISDQGRFSAQRGGKKRRGKSLAEKND